MGHKVLIGGTAYEVSGGRCLVDGTGYDIKKGRTLVGGTGYDVVFAQPCTVTITGTGDATYCYVTIGGKTYTGAATVEVESGTVMICYTYGAFGSVNVNGAIVAQSEFEKPAKYSYTVYKNISVSISNASRTISITE